MLNEVREQNQEVLDEKCARAEHEQQKKRIKAARKRKPLRDAVSPKDFLFEYSLRSSKPLGTALRGELLF